MSFITLFQRSLFVFCLLLEVIHLKLSLDCGSVYLGWSLFIFLFIELLLFPHIYKSYPVFCTGSLWLIFLSCYMSRGIT